MNKQFLPSVILALAYNLMRAFVPFNVRPTLGASTLPLVPNDASSLTLKVAKAIKPTDSVGSLTDNLLGNRDVEANEDVISVISFDADGLATVKVFPSGTANAALVDAGAAKVATITRDDTDSETSPHTITEAAGHGDDVIVTSSAGVFAPSKPARSLSSMINAFVDNAVKQEIDLSGFVLVHTTVGDGKLEVYDGDLGTGAGAIASVTQEASAPSTPKATRW